LARSWSCRSCSVARQGWREVHVPPRPDSGRSARPRSRRAPRHAACPWPPGPRLGPGLRCQPSLVTVLIAHDAAQIGQQIGGKLIRADYDGLHRTAQRLITPALAVQRPRGLGSAIRIAYPHHAHIMSSYVPPAPAATRENSDHVHPGLGDALVPPGAEQRERGGVERALIGGHLAPLE